jgi:hypothetical protein
MAVIELLEVLVACDPDLVGIYDDYIITAVNMGCERRLMLAS